MNLETSNIATALIVIIAVVGGALVILSAITTVDPALRLGFRDYIEALALGAGLLAVGRGAKALNRRVR